MDAFVCSLVHLYGLQDVSQNPNVGTDSQLSTFLVICIYLDIDYIVAVFVGHMFFSMCVLKITMIAEEIFSENFYELLVVFTFFLSLGKPVMCMWTLKYSLKYI